MSRRRRRHIQAGARGMCGKSFSRCYFFFLVFFSSQKYHDIEHCNPVATTPPTRTRHNKPLVSRPASGRTVRFAPCVSPFHAVDVDRTPLPRLVVQHTPRKAVQPRGTRRAHPSQQAPRAIGLPPRSVRRRRVRAGTGHGVALQRRVQRRAHRQPLQKRRDNGQVTQRSFHQCHCSPDCNVYFYLDFFFFFQVHRARDEERGPRQLRGARQRRPLPRQPAAHRWRLLALSRRRLFVFKSS
jgi:hypothetical protein